MSNHMSKLASILACCAVASLFSLGAQALPGSPVPAPFAASDITPVSACGPGYYKSRTKDRCFVKAVPHPEPRTYGGPYAGPQAFGLPYVEPPAVKLPYVEVPVRLPYVEPPAVRLPYVEVPVRLPYVEPPVVGLPYVELPVLGTPHTCPSGYFHSTPYRRCVAI
ncbi:hypothetical protein [Bradyrhizobium sp.]|jgi:hypothetical protein|uniref:hypothetical protein n=1 Tax=Bradyrhizobium sp. TaxID=376 RepID=UPI003D113144